MADDPSFRVDELPAVTEPPCRKTARKLLSFSRLLSGLGPSSCEKICVFFRPAGTSSVRFRCRMRLQLVPARPFAVSQVRMHLALGE